MGLLREINVFRGGRRLLPVLGRSTVVIINAVASWIRGEKPGKPGRPRRKKRGKQPSEETPAAKNGGDHSVLGLVLLVLLAGYGLVYLTGDAPWLWLVIGGAWLIGCLVIAAARGDFPREDPDDDPAEALDEAPLAPAETAVEPPRIELARWLLSITHNANGIHLRDLYPLMRQQPAIGPLPDRDLRALLNHHRIPVKRTLTVGHVEGRSGIARAALLDILQGHPDDTPRPTKSTPPPPASRPTLGPFDLRKSRPPRAPESTPPGRSPSTESTPD